MHIVSRTSHPTLPGVEKILYRLPKKDPTGAVIPGQFRTIVYTKTVFDPSLISLNEFIRRGVEAANNVTSINQDRYWQASDSFGILWDGYIRDTDGQIRTFWPFIEPPVSHP